MVSLPEVAFDHIAHIAHRDEQKTFLGLVYKLSHNLQFLY